MALTDKLTDIADAIRAKNRKTEQMTLSQMAEEIGKLSTEEIINHAAIPDYVKAEALRVANNVQSALAADSIVFIAHSDNHHYAPQQSSDQYPDASGIQTTASNLHAAMAAKILAYVLRADFVAHMGDMVWGNGKTTPQILHGQVDALTSALDEAWEGIPEFRCIGNHDTGIYYHNAMIDSGKTGVFTESADYLYNAFTARSASDNTVFGGAGNGGYCYRDFPDKKLRVFLLNTSEALTVKQQDGGTLGSQRKWFADALVSLNGKADATDWSFIVLSHYPADYGNTMPLSELLKAYVEGNSISIALESGSSATVNFSGKNAAKMIAQFHGHIHNFLVSKLHSYATGSAVKFDAWRVCIPNGQFDRENYYTTVGGYSGISFKDDVAYGKTANSSKDTSFVVNVINPSEQKIHSFCYGAGVDRVVGYAATVYYSVNAALTNVTLTGGASSVEKGMPYTATLSIASGYEWGTVKITMGGADITSSVYNNGAIDIPSVTGNIVITATAQMKVLYINQIPISTNANGAVISDTGYLENTYLGSSNGAEGYNWDFECTGFIPCKVGDIVRLKNVFFSKTTNSGSNRVAFYGSDRAFIKIFNAGQTYDTQAVADGDGNWTQFTVPSVAAGAAYFRLCCDGITAASIITVNQEIVA